MVGGAKGGSGQYVYQLGRRGFYMFNDARYIKATSVNYHSIAIVDAYLAICRATAGVALSLATYTTEPECWAVVGREHLKPDLYVELTPEGQEPLRLWLEVDLGTESQSRIKEKLERYWRAYNSADPEEWPVFPSVMFVATDVERERELRYLIQQGPKDAQALFNVCELSSLERVLTP